MKKSELLFKEIGEADEKYLSETKRPKRNFIKYIAAAAAVLIVIGVAVPVALNRSPDEMALTAIASIISAALKKAPGSIQLPGDVTVTADNDPKGNDNGVQLTVKRETGDRISESGIVAEKSAEMADRDIYRGIRFYENGGKTYMFYQEDGRVYEFNGKGFRDTGIKPAEKLFFSEGTYNGFAYVSGVFRCVGGTENGLFKVDLETGVTEKYIDCRDIVVSVAVNGPDIWYSTYVYKSDGYVYSLKHANADTGEITVLLEADYWISNIEICDGDLFFRSYYGGVYRITPEYKMYKYEMENVYDYTVSEGRIYIYSIEFLSPDGGHKNEIQKETVKVYGYDGNVCGGVQFEFNRSGAISAEKGECQVIGASCDHITVYNGRLVVFDNKGVYLYDFEDNTLTLAADLNVSGGSYERMYVSKTVYNDKLYIQFKGGITEYDGEKSVTYNTK